MQMITKNYRSTIIVILFSISLGSTVATERFDLKNAITDNPKKTTVGSALALYGAKLLYEANKTGNINNGYEKVQGIQNISGAALLIGGVIALLPTIYTFFSSK